MADQPARLEAATVRAEVGSNILYRFSNDPVGAEQIPTLSGPLKNLKQVSAEILQEGSDAVSSAVAEGVVDLTEAVESASSSAAQAISARDAAKISSGIKEDIAQGMATTSPGEYFSVPSPESNEYLILYQNSAGSPKEIDSYPNAKSVSDIQEVLKVIADQSTDFYYKGKKVMSGEADSLLRASIITLEDGSVEIPKFVLAEPALEVVQGRIDAAVAGTATADAIWPTTAMGALAQAARRRVDFVMIGDSNQKKDGYGWGGGFMRALHDRFGCYATAVGSQSPLTLSGYTKTGESNYGVEGGAVGTGAPSEIETVFPTSVFGFPEGTRGGMGPAWLADGLTITSGASAGGVSVLADHAIGVSNMLRAHYAWVSLNRGAGSFQVRARLDGSPFTAIASAPVTPTNTGEYSLHRQTLDIPAGVRTNGIECKWYIPGGAALTGPFAAAWFRLENPAKHTGISVSTFFGVGGQSLYDMANYLLSAPIQVLIDWFGETRRLQLLDGQKPMVVVYMNSGLNDQNETMKPSLGWRAVDEPQSAAAYFDNAEAIVKRISDAWQKAGWDETELFFMIIPSHPVSTPDAPKLLSYRKAADAFAGRQRASFVDLTNITSNAEMLANNWYMDNNTDTNHLVQEAYRVLGARIVSLIPELDV